MNNMLNTYKEKTNKEYKSLRYPNPQITPPDLLNLVANIKVAEATTRYDEIAGEIKTGEMLGGEEIKGKESPLQLELNNLENEIALWQPYSKV